MLILIFKFVWSKFTSIFGCIWWPQSSWIGPKDFEMWYLNTNNGNRSCHIFPRPLFDVTGPPFAINWKFKWSDWIRPECFYVNLARCKTKTSGQFHQHLNMSAFAPIFLRQKEINLKIWVQISCAQNFRTKKPHVKCWWIWHLVDKQDIFIWISETNI